MQKTTAKIPIPILQALLSRGPMCTIPPKVHSSRIFSTTLRYTLLLMETDSEMTVFQDSPHHLQQTFLNQLVSRCVLRLESHNNYDLAVYNLQKTLDEDVHQDISHWLHRLQGAVYRVSERPLHPLLSSFTRRDLAQRTVERLQREFNNAKAPNDSDISEHLFHRL